MSTKTAYCNEQLNECRITNEAPEAFFVDHPVKGTVAMGKSEKEAIRKAVKKFGEEWFEKTKEASLLEV